MQLHQPETLAQIASLDGRLLVVSFAPLAEFTDWTGYFQKHSLRPYYKDHNLDIGPGTLSRTQFVADPELGVYHAYGMGRYSRWTAYGPSIVRQYLKFLFQGKPLRLPSQDTLQRGGDFVIGRDGRLTLSHVGTDQSDRPLVSDLLAAMRK